MSESERSESKPKGDIWDDIPEYDSTEQAISHALDACTYDTERTVEPWEYEPIHDVSDRWDITPDDAEIFLESIGYYGRNVGTDPDRTEVNDGR